MRKLIATVFNYSLDGLLADEGTEFWKFCFSLPENREPDDPAQLDFIQGAYAHIMGRTAYEGIAGAMTTSTDHPFAPILNAARKVVFSRTLKTADWANTTIAAGDTAEEIDKLRQGGDGYIVAWGGVSFLLWHSGHGDERCARRRLTDPRPQLYADSRQMLADRRSFRVSWC
jgi:dihydrofolate reductase